MDGTRQAASERSPEAKLCTRPCRNCGENMPANGAECPRCGWYPGIVPIAQAQGSDGTTTTTFVKEKRHTFLAAFGVLATVIGLVSVFTGGTAGIVLGSLVAVAGIASFKMTHFGKVWWGLDSSAKTKALPGLVVGGAIGVLLIPILILGVAILKIFDLRDL